MFRLRESPPFYLVLHRCLFYFSAVIWCTECSTYHASLCLWLFLAHLPRGSLQMRSFVFLLCWFCWKRIIIDYPPPPNKRKKVEAPFPSHEMKDVHKSEFLRNKFTLLSKKILPMQSWTTIPGVNLHKWRASTKYRQLEKHHYSYQLISTIKENLILVHYNAQNNPEQNSTCYIKCGTGKGQWNSTCDTNG